MRKFMWLVFTLFLLSTMSMVFGQTDQEAVSSKNDETEVSTAAQEPQKVSEMRKATRIATPKEVQDGKTTKEVVYDAKGGIVVPDKSEGMKQTQLTPAQQSKLAQIKGEKTPAATPQTKFEKDLSASEKGKSQNDQSKKSQKPKSD